MVNDGHDLPQKSLQIKQDDKFFARLLSKESSKAEASFRVLYYGGASGAVPFTWESQPGTPKHPSSSTSLPPLSPPPSYQFSPKTNSMQKGSKPNFLFANFPRIASKKNHVSPALSSSSMSSSCSSGSYSSSSTPRIRRRFWLPRSRSAVRFRIDEGDDDDGQQATGDPTSTLCFGFPNGFLGSRSKVNAKYPL